jgi:transglutaminase-like putative cysteine protease
MNLWFPTILYSLVIAGMGSLLMTRWIPLPWILLALIAIPWGFLSDLKGRYLLKPAMNRLLLALGIALAIIDSLWVSRHPFITVMDLMIYLVAIRLLSPKANRDLIQIIALSFFCLLGSAALTSDLIYALFFILFSSLLPWGLLMVSVKAEMEGERDMLRGKVAQPRPLTLPPGFSQVMSRGLAFRMILAIGTTFLMTFLFFTFFPRFTLGQLAGKLSLREPLSGFTPEIRLGEMGRILEDPTPVARVQTTYRPEAEIYLRGLALDQFNGTTWKHTPHHRNRLYSSEGRFRLEDPDPHTPKGIATIYLEDTGTKILFTIPRTIGITLPSPILFLEEDESLSTPSMSFPFRYEVEFVEDTLPSYPWHRLKLPLSVPSSLTRYLELPPAEDLPGEILAHSKEQDGSFIPELLQQFARYRYTLELPSSPHPLKTFFERKAGHCELFATAFALILRSAGIPARVVSGFRGGEWIPEKGYYLIRQRNAHSWVEAWVPDRGWIPLDPTPPAPPPQDLLLRLQERLQRAVELLRFLWLEYVVDYNLRTQKELIRSSHKRLIIWQERLRSGFRLPSVRAPGEKILPWILLLLGILFTLFMLLPRARFLSPRGRENPLFPLLQTLEKKYGPKPPSTPLNLWAESHLPPGFKERFRSLYGEYAVLYYRSGAPPKTIRALTPKIRRFIEELERERSGSSEYNKNFAQGV